MKTIPKQEIRERLYRRRFLVPNSVTVGNLFCGFLSVLYASQSRFQDAVIALGIAILLDGVDGRVARRLNASSAFGLEFDSLADVVSFGIAPATLVYYWGLSPLANEFGVLVSFLYVLCTATRLARFNILDTNLKSFSGLPSPGAAGAIIALVNIKPILEPSLITVSCISIYVACIAFLMISPFEFFSIKSLGVGRIKFSAKVFIGLAIATIWYSPKIGIFVLATGYALSGVVISAKNKFKPPSSNQSLPTLLSAARAEEPTTPHDDLLN